MLAMKFKFMVLGRLVINWSLLELQQYNFFNISQRFRTDWFWSMKTFLQKIFTEWQVYNCMLFTLSSRKVR